MFNFGRADAEAECAERTVGRRVAVAANHHHPRADKPLFVHQYVLNALVRIVGTVKGVDAEMPAVGFERFGLPEGRSIVNAARRFVLGRNDVVDDAKVRVGDRNVESALAQSCKGLRRGVLVREMNVAVEKHSRRIDCLHRMRVDNLSVERAWHFSFSCHSFFSRDFF